MLCGCAVGVQGVDESNEQGAPPAALHGSLATEAVWVEGNGAREPGSPVFGPYNARGTGGAARASVAGDIFSTSSADDSDEHARDDTARDSVRVVGGPVR